jgi:hypothetical protein
MYYRSDNMEINFKNSNTVDFEDLRIGSEFIYKDKLYIKTISFEGSECEYGIIVNAVDVIKGDLCHFHCDDKVIKCECKIDVEY